MLEEQHLKHGEPLATLQASMKHFIEDDNVDDDQANALLAALAGFDEKHYPKLLEFVSNVRFSSPYPNCFASF